MGEKAGDKNLIMKTFLFIDGSNLYGGFTDLLKPGEYLKFDDFLKKIEKEIPVSKIMFYGTYMKEDEHKTTTYRLKAKAQIEFFNSVKLSRKVEFYEGHFSATSGKEKGVDVRLAVDMVLGACTNEYDQAIIMSGDADLTYAVIKAKQFKKIHLMAFASRFPYGMSFKANKRFVFDYKKHFQKKALFLYRNKPKYLKIIDITKSVKVLHI